MPPSPKNQAPTKIAGDPLEEISAREARTILAEELDRLSAAYREPILLCLYQGATQDEAARQLGCSRRTLKRRLERDRNVLGQRLTRRSLAPATALALTLYASSRAPAQLARATIVAATQFISGKALTGSAALLAQGMLQTWLLKTMAGYLGIVVVLGGLTLAGGLAFSPRERDGGKQGLVLAAQTTAPPIKAKDAPRVDINGDPLPPGALARIGSSPSAPLSSGEPFSLYAGRKSACIDFHGRFPLRLGFRQRQTALCIKVDAENATIVGTLTVSGDGKRLAVLNDSKLALVELETGKMLIRHDWQRGNNEPNALSVALSQDQKAQIARGCGDGTVHLYDAVTGREKLRFVLNKNARDYLPMGMRFSADSKKIYVAPYRKSAIMVFETQGGKDVQSAGISRARWTLCNLVISQKHQWLAAMQHDRFVIWDLMTGKRRAYLSRISQVVPLGSFFA